MDLYSAFRYKITSNALVTLVAAKENYFHEPFKTTKTVRIPKFIWQRVPHCRAGVVDYHGLVRHHSITYSLQDNHAKGSSSRSPNTRRFLGLISFTN